MLSRIIGVCARIWGRTVEDWKEDRLTILERQVREDFTEKVLKNEQEFLK